MPLCVVLMKPEDIIVPQMNFWEYYIMNKDDLQECYELMAYIVNKHGDDYLPLFERLHEEIEARKEKNNLLEIASKVAGNASKNDTHNGTHFGTH